MKVGGRGVACQLYYTPIRKGTVAAELAALDSQEGNRSYELLGYKVDFWTIIIVAVAVVWSFEAGRSPGARIWRWHSRRCLRRHIFILEGS